MTSTQKIIKYLALALAAFLVFSIFSGICGAVVFVAGFLSYSTESDHQLLQMETVYDSGAPAIRHLDVELAASNLEIVIGDRLCVETDNPYITVKERGDTLHIREKNHISKLQGSTLILYIPEQAMLDQVEISTGAGLIHAQALDCKDLSLDLGAGKVEISNLNVTEETDIEGGAGQITLNSSKLHNLDFDMGVGEAEVVALVTGECDISAGIGTLHLTVPASMDDYTIRAEQGLGKVTVDGVSLSDQSTLGSGPNRMNISGIGNIKLDFE